jgi:hypothetical protein
MFRLRLRYRPSFLFVTRRHVSQYGIALLILPYDPHRCAAPGHGNVVGLADGTKTIELSARDGK